MSSVFDLLDHEWSHLSRDRGAARRLPEACAVAGNAATLDDLERYVRTTGPAAADRVLLELIGRVVDHGDQLAARVLLQLLLPGARSLARRWWALGDQDERAAAAVSAVYGRIRTYPLRRRPGRIAANVLLDAARDLRRAVPRLITAPTADPSAHSRHESAEPLQLDPAEELAEILADAVDAGVIELGDAQIIAQSRIVGRRVADIATGHRLGTRTLWDRRHRAEARLAAAYAACA
jgi:hypothetical protein